MTSLRFTKNEVIHLEPEHEQVILVGEREIADESVRVKCSNRVHIPDHPHVTYWSVEYLDETPNNAIGDTRVIAETTLSSHQVLSGRVTSTIQHSDD